MTTETLATLTARRLRMAAVVAGVAALVTAAFWATSSSPEAVQVEEMTAPDHVQPLANEVVAVPNQVEEQKVPENVVPVATIPAPAPVELKAPVAQPIVPVVRSAASGATSAAVSSSRTRDAAVKNVKPAVRRQRDTRRYAVSPSDVIPNPYHD